MDRDAVAGDAVVFHAGFIQRNFDYYSKRANVRKLPAPDLSAASGRDLTKWVSGLTASEHVWLVEAYHRDAEGRIRQAMLTSLEPVECWEYESESYATGKRLTITVSRFLQKRDP